MHVDPLDKDEISAYLIYVPISAIRLSSRSRNNIPSENHSLGVT